MSSGMVIKAFDRLSDTLCSVLDLAEFVRNSHPDQRYVAAAEQAYGILHGFMNQLNTHVGLFAALKHICDSPGRLGILDKQQLAVLEVLLADFHRSGVHLNDNTRANFVELSTVIANAERKAFTDYAPAKTEILFTTDEAKGLWPNPNTGMMTPDGKHIRVPTTGWEADSAMQRLDRSASRQKLLEAMQTPRDDQLQNMTNLFRVRGRLAEVVGKQSWGASVLEKQMATAPEQVESFLVNLANSIRPRAIEETNILTQWKQRHLRTARHVDLHKWDEDYYSAMHVRSLKQTPMGELSPYLSVGTVIQGLSRLFEQMYGVRFSVREMRPGEAWHSDVRCLDVISDNHGLIGTLYCDLFSRPGKDTGLAAHFTVRCGRRLENDALLPGEEDIDNGMLSGTIEGIEYQLPVIALQCDFAPSRGNNFASLSFQEVNTLFHEMGHAIHSMLGTTAYQTVSGTRVAADLVELPSQIMESFVESPAVWPLFARHHKTDRVAPLELQSQALQHSRHLNGISSYRQFIRSLLDQRFHSSLATSDAFDSTRVLADLEREYSLTSNSDPTYPWQVQFTHLAGYGGTYYSYIFDKAIADRIWTKTFQVNPLSRDAGENFKMNLLRHGGARDPWKCLADVLKEPELAAGDANAMASVGQWAAAR
ncbi:Mitochondrial intermediate peptidase [Taphrina deformans PYCC 5710]|uniref:Mitochondrial intermediate peptidase n=1 Tax=Taphrina deformans (strain PYCC 5710 / ATCC 11124 / CBS 356.35 / IMI 108563 / JCM 9778 / NBRC 8474) TaxID=1097556 RepID=R4XJ57_TAPDE|nr:Mitochondrial intermediate peptidase [Taphrina deformans PYCC 5710]|eukprot:CCG83405.1 Mitochondrial intermediate peptidase [Taphrina deformans PYCC 5710]